MWEAAARCQVPDILCESGLRRKHPHANSRASTAGRPCGRRQSGRSSGVEHNLAKVGVEGSNPFARSSFFITYQPLMLLPTAAKCLLIGASHHLTTTDRLWRVGLGLAHITPKSARTGGESIPLPPRQCRGRPFLRAAPPPRLCRNSQAAPEKSAQKILGSGDPDQFPVAKSIHGMEGVKCQARQSSVRYHGPYSHSAYAAAS